MTQMQPAAHNGSVAHAALSEQAEPARDPHGAGWPAPPSAPADWPAHWLRCGQPWRTAPEIGTARQQQLAAYRAVAPDPQQGRYPFMGVQLARADIEWLLATHEHGQGPIDWQDEAQRRRKGLDLRGALLSGDLRGLPLARLQGGLAREEWDGWVRAHTDQLALAAIDMAAADLFSAHLAGANLTSARLQRADLRLANLEGSNLTGANLEGANLTGANLEGANLTGASLEGAYLTGANLSKANLHRAQLKRAILFGTQLNEAALVGANLEGATLEGANLEGASLRQARLGRAALAGTLKGVDLADAALADAQGIGPRLAAVQWGMVDLSAVAWSQITQLDDEYAAASDGGPALLAALKSAARAYRQLAHALRTQGLVEEAAAFAYRAHAVRRQLLRRQLAAGPARALGAWLASLARYIFASFLDLTTGYGYKPWRSVVSYLLIIGAFALAYAAFAQIALLPDALALSLAGFHGRGFVPGQSGAGASMALAALEATVGLLIEVSYIVVFTKRFLEQ